MKTDYLGRTCNFCLANPPNNAPLQMEVHVRNRLQLPTSQTRKLVSALFKYSNVLICNQVAVICGAEGVAAEVDESAAKTKTKTGSVTLFPNPVLNMLHIHFDALPVGEYQISLTDINGRKVFNKTSVYNNGKSSADIDMSSFIPGVYMLVIKKNGVVFEQKIMKQ
jgi:hypothetical protein